MIKQVIIHDKNRDKINEILAAGQKRARERKISDYTELLELVEKYMQKISSIPKKYLYQCELYIYIGAAKFPNKYKGIPYGTRIVITFNKKGEYMLKDVSRENVNGEKEYYFNMTDAAKTFVLHALNITGCKLVTHGENTYYV
jgi:hypothetical protein